MAEAKSAILLNLRHHISYSLFTIERDLSLNKERAYRVKAVIRRFLSDLTRRPPFLWGKLARRLTSLTGSSRPTMVLGPTKADKDFCKKKKNVGLHGPQKPYFSGGEGGSAQVTAISHTRERHYFQRTGGVGVLAGPFFILHWGGG